MMSNIHLLMVYANYFGNTFGMREIGQIVNKISAQHAVRANNKYFHREIVLKCN